MSINASIRVLARKSTKKDWERKKEKNTKEEKRRRSRERRKHEPGTIAHRIKSCRMSRRRHALAVDLQDFLPKTFSRVSKRELYVASFWNPLLQCVSIFGSCCTNVAYHLFVVETQQLSIGRWNIRDVKAGLTEGARMSSSPVNPAFVQRQTRSRLVDSHNGQPRCPVWVICHEAVHC